MKRTLYKNIIFLIFLVAICFLSAGVNAAETVSVTGWLAANDQPAYDVPAEKQQKWESLQAMVKKQYNACIEDCGNNDDCLKKCKKAYKARLDREYKKLKTE